MRKIGIGMIGCGGMGRFVARQVIENTREIEVVGLFDPEPAQIATTLKLFPQAKVYTSYQELLASPELRWVLIASWNCYHREQVQAAFKAGKDVFCQKPLATTPEDCLAMLDAWRSSGRQFNIGFTLRYSPHYRKLRQLLDENVIGELISFEFNETLNFNHGGYIMGDWRRLQKNAGTHLLEKCCHDIDLANWMAGSLASRVASFGGLNFFLPKNERHMQRIGKSKDGKEDYRTWAGKTVHNPFTSDKDIVDNQVAIIEYANGVRATFHANCNTAIPERRMYFCGSEGTIRADVISGKIEVKRIGFDTQLENISAGVDGGHGGGDEVLSAELRESILHGTEPATGLLDGLKSAFTCFAIDKAMTTRQVVELAPLWEKAGIKP